MSVCCRGRSSGWTTPDSATTGNIRLPRLRAAPTSAAHHGDRRYADVTTQTTASAQRSRSCRRFSHSSPSWIPSCGSRSRNTSCPSSTSHRRTSAAGSGSWPAWLMKTRAIAPPQP
ncbi:hypothetical protein BJF90_17775 [Pseudonocardia sp. CNS-004]|nr:hypothetical protein BJF90_17775 [Pseudonocardia sp. CNS-004]